MLALSMAAGFCVSTNGFASASWVNDGQVHVHQWPNHLNALAVVFGCCAVLSATHNCLQCADSLCRDSVPPSLETCFFLDAGFDVPG